MKNSTAKREISEDKFKDSTKAKLILSKKSNLGFKIFIKTTMNEEKNLWKGMSGTMRLLKWDLTAGMIDLPMDTPVSSISPWT